MKRLIIIFGSIISLIGILSVLFLYSWIGNGVKENIAIAKGKYPGNAEEALIAFLQDEKNPARDRTHAAIWTLGQIKSENALPILNDIYKNDPEGKSCYGKHDSLLCQYEIYKAIKTIEGNRVFSHARLRTR